MRLKNTPSHSLTLFYYKDVIRRLFYVFHFGEKVNEFCLYSHYTCRNVPDRVSGTAVDICKTTSTLVELGLITTDTIVAIPFSSTEVIFFPRTRIRVSV